MFHDYYMILGVNETADITAIRSAFRKLALKYHPDKGGSDEQMLMINEAWFVLSDPSNRAHYDSYRKNTGNRESQIVVAKDAAKAQERAHEYPRNYKDFESWLDRVAKDFTNAKYGSSKGTFGIEHATIENSSSGGIFWFIGASLGAFAGFMLAYSMGLNGAVAAVAVVGCGAVGTFITSEIHKSIASSLKPPVSAQKNNGANPVAEKKHELIQCENCKQQLRIPITTPGERITVRCPSCKQTFSTPLTCPACGARNRKNTKFCADCGASTVIANVCNKCNSHLEPNAKFCGNCGAKLNN